HSSLHRKLPQEAKRILLSFLLLHASSKGKENKISSSPLFIYRFPKHLKERKSPQVSFSTRRTLRVPLSQPRDTSRFFKPILPLCKPKFPPKAFKETSSSLRFLGFLFPFASAVFPWLEKGMKSGMNDGAVELGTAEEGRADA
ncbi:hypothetical protein F2P56_015393, partial [Juglans regia]